jgi:hypothetical protein
VIQRRHVFYVEGYDPQGASGYYGIFQYAAKRCRKVWSIALDVGPLNLDTELLAHWDIQASGPNWRASTRYEFLRLEGVLNANMSQPMWRQVPRALSWAFDDLLSGTTARILKASRRFAIHLIFFQAMLIAWLTTSAASGVLAGFLAGRLLDLPIAASIPLALAAAVAVFALLRPLASRWFVIQINNCWPHLREFASGAPSALNHPIDVCAERIVTAARTNEADEIVVIGHSGGGVTAPAVVARALELDPDLGRRGPRVVLLTPGSIMPAAALHPSADKLRSTVRRIASEPSLRWIDCQCHTDWLNFPNFDPVEGIGIHLGTPRHNPTIWPVRFRDMLTPEAVAQMKWNPFRIHYQFIMGNDKRAPYDYVMLSCGPVPVEDWSKRNGEIVESFLGDGTYRHTTASLQPHETSMAPGHRTSIPAEQPKDARAEQRP